MRKRDKEIIKLIETFRYASRNDIEDLFFSELKYPTPTCNNVMKRLVLQGHVEVCKQFQPYVYCKNGAKKDSQKIHHYLKIVDFYKKICAVEQPKSFLVEPRYGKKGEYMEPDVFMIFKRTPIFVEIVREAYSSSKVIEEKKMRYERYYASEEWRKEAWQPEAENKKVFPRVLMISDTRYDFQSAHFPIFQVQHVEDFIKMLPSNQPKPEPAKIKPMASNGEIKIRLN